MKYRQLLTAVVFCLLSAVSIAQNTPVYRVGLILPFETEYSLGKLAAYASAHDVFTASRISLPADALASLDFYQGALQSLNESNENIKIELSVYDNVNSDSVTREILSREELKNLDVIIGSISVSSAKLIADFCRAHQIVNIQPFTPSKSLTISNPFHLKLAPTLDAHVDALFQSIVDSFATANVIVYGPDNSSSLAVMRRFDTLFTEYNSTAEKKLTFVSINTKDMLVNGKKTTVKEQLNPAKTNVLLMTAFEESFVNGNLRVLFDSREKNHLIVFGMPNWLDGDVMRLDYINDFSTRLTSPFYVDSAKEETQHFISNYHNAYGTPPSSNAHLGYDVMNFLLQSLSDYGKEFLGFISTQRYSGTAYKFDIIKNVKTPPAVNYYENRHVNVFMIQDYRMVKID